MKLHCFLVCPLLLLLSCRDAAPPPPAKLYAEEWKQIDSLFSKEQLPKSALEAVERIYGEAKAQNNTVQVIKALIHKMLFFQEVEEEALVKVHREMREELKTLKFPESALLHSMIAEQYWNYYQQNQWTYRSRSKITDFQQDDMRTWDLQRIADEISRHYWKSLEKAEALQDIDISEFGPLINRGTADEEFRPSLYDFLAHRALDFFTGELSRPTLPAGAFSMTGTEYLAPFRTFSRMTIPVSDTAASQYRALRIFQDLLNFHTHKRNLPALIDADIRRLKFVYDNLSADGSGEAFEAALKGLAQNYRSYPAAAMAEYERAKFYYTQGTSYRSGRSDLHQWKKKQAADCCAAASEKYPGSYGAGMCSDLLYDIRTRSIELNIEAVVVPHRPFTGLAEYSNVRKIYLKAVPAFGDESHRYGGAGVNLQKRILKTILEREPVLTWGVGLPDSGDYQKHTAEFMIEGLKPGVYALLASDEENFDFESGAVFCAFFTASHIAFLQREESGGQLEFAMMDRESGKPISGIIARSWSRNQDNRDSAPLLLQGPSYRSDDQGKINIQSKEDYSTFYLEFIKGTDTLFVHKAFGTYSRRDREKPRTQTFFYTDRAAYRPGQTVYFKGIMLEKNSIPEEQKVLTNKAATVTLFDPNHEKINSLDLVTNRFGSFKGEFRLPGGLLNGRFYIRSESGVVSFSVEEYKRPRFEVKFEKAEKEFRLNEVVELKGTAKALGGFSIGGAEVRYKVVRRTIYSRNLRFTGSVDIASGTLTSGSNGEFTIGFKAASNPALSIRDCPSYTFDITADVTDLNGETRSASKTITLGYKALKLIISMPEYVERTNGISAEVHSLSLSDDPVPAGGTVDIYRLREPGRIILKSPWYKQPDRHPMTKKDHLKAFPLRAYGDEDDPRTWEREKQYFQGEFNTEKSRSLEIPDASDWPSGRYVMVLKTKDRFGEAVEDKHGFTLFSTKDKKPPLITADWFASLKTEAEPGDSAVFVIGSSETGVNVLQEIHCRNKIVQSQYFTLNGEQKVISIPVEKIFQGDFTVSFSFIRHNRAFIHSEQIHVPWSSKKLDISFETFRSRLLPGEKETWHLKISGPEKDRVAAEMAAVLYDASLDAVRYHNWRLDLFPTFRSRLNWNGNESFQTSWFHALGQLNEPQDDFSFIQYGSLNWYGFRMEETQPQVSYMMRVNSAMEPNEVIDNVSGLKKVGKSRISPRRGKSIRAGNAAYSGGGIDDMLGGLLGGDDMRVGVMAKGKLKAERNGNAETPGLTGITARTNLNETAFFFPHLKTDKNGNVIIAFTMPEAITRWKMLGLAHTPDLKTGTIQNELITRKDLMVVPNAPRFFRENDKLVFTSKVINLTDTLMAGNAQLMLFDAMSMRPVDSLFGNSDAVREFSVEKKGSALVRWKLSIPEGIGAVTYRVAAKSGNFTDGEEDAVPVLTNRMLVTETLPLPVKAEQTKTFEFTKLLHSDTSKTLKHHKLTLEFTSNPAWYAVQALPYMMEYPYDCYEQTFSRYYANSIAAHIASASPRIRKVFDSWKRSGKEGALLSNLEKNQELKSLLLQETPWVLDAKNETERKKRVGLLFDMHRMSRETAAAWKKLEQGQKENGAWPWFSGMGDNRYITQHILIGLARLRALKAVGEDSREGVTKTVLKAIEYLDGELRKDVERLKERGADLEADHLGHLQIHYLYARSYFQEIEMDKPNRTAFDYYMGQAEKYWKEKGRYMQGMIALTLHRSNKPDMAKGIIQSIREHALTSDEMGMYWKDSYGYSWHQAPIETQALMIEAFSEVTDDAQAVEGLKTWLIKSKQTQDWGTTKATADACYALLMQGSDWLAGNRQAAITMGGTKVDPEKLPGAKPEAGTGYFKTSWTGKNISPGMGKIQVTNPNKSPAWGAVYWQYFEQLDRITPHETPLMLKKQLFLEKITRSGPELSPLEAGSKLKVGDRVIVRIELRVDRDMEFVHMKDMRAAGFEPENVLSRYKWQDGLGYYESTRDASTNFFMDNLPKGTFVFEYPLRASHQGDFSNGITSIQCMYAPEFASHSEGVQIKIAD